MRLGYPNPCLPAPPSQHEEDPSEDGGTKKNEFGPGGTNLNLSEGLSGGGGVERLGRWAMCSIRRRTPGYVMLLTYQGFPPSEGRGGGGIPLLLITSEPN